MSTRMLVTVVLSSPIPPIVPHAISVCIPTWKDNFSEKRVVDSVVTGYPRTFIRQSIKKVCGPSDARSPLPSALSVLSTLFQRAKICQQRFGVNGKGYSLLPTSTVANHCRTIIIQQAAKDNVGFSVPVIQFLHPGDKDRRLGAELHIVSFPTDKIQYTWPRPSWSHTGWASPAAIPNTACLSFPKRPSTPKSAHVYDSERRTETTTRCSR